MFLGDQLAFKHVFFFCYLASGLSLVLNIEADDYYEDFSESYGAVVDVTSTMEMHFPEENGYLIAPGQATNIGFTKVSFPKFLAGHIKPHHQHHFSHIKDNVYLASVIFTTKIILHV